MERRATTKLGETQGKLGEPKKRRRWVEILFIILLLLHIVGTTWFREVINVSNALNRAATFCYYLPFMFSLIAKIAFDMKRQSLLYKRVDIFYYLFVLYYMLISFYRIFFKYEYKESIYVFLVSFGTISALSLYMDDKIQLNRFDLKRNINIMCAAVLTYWLWYRVHGYRFFNNPLINNNIVLSVIVLSVPSLIMQLKDEKKSISAIWLLVPSIICVLITGSRVNLLILVMQVICSIALMLCLNRKMIRKFIRVLLYPLIIVSVLYLNDVPTVRYYVSRAFSFIIQVNNTKNSVAELAVQQTVRADNMRMALIARGLKELGRNILVGTGDVFYEIEVYQGYVTKQSSHNFVIELLVCFGVMGFLILILIVHDVFRSIRRIRGMEKGMMLLTVFSFLLMSSVEPLVYNNITCYTFAFVMMGFIAGARAEWKTSHSLLTV